MGVVKLVCAGVIGSWSAAAWAQTSPSDFTYGARFDAARRLTGTIAPDPDGTGPLRHAAVRHSFDASGRLTRTEQGELSSWEPETVPPANWQSFTVHSQTDYEYDGLDRKIVERVSGGGSTFSLSQFSYDAAGRLECTAVRMNPARYSELPASACSLSVEEPAFGPDRITRTTYDAAGQARSMSRAVGTTLEQVYVAYEYTPNGKPRAVTDAKGNRAELTYDGFDRVGRWYFPSPDTVGAINQADFEEYDYDANNNRISFRRRDGRVLSYGYDSLNRLVSKTVPDGCAPINQGACPPASATRDVFYGYDLRGLQTYARFDRPDGQGVEIAYDGFGQPVTSRLAMSGFDASLTFQYDANGNRTRVSHSDGNWFGFTYDGLDRQFDANVRGDHNNPTYRFVYNAAGLPSHRISGGRTTWLYDGADRLQSLREEAPTSTSNHGNVLTSYAYNPAGQQITRSRDNDAYAFNAYFSVDRNYSVNGLNQYLSAGSTSFSYDPNGNVIGDGTRTYSYDAENRLISASNGTTLSYDPLGRLFEVAGRTETTRFLYEGDRLTAEYDASGNLLRRYKHGLGEDQPLVWYEGTSVAPSNARPLKADHQGSIIQVVDSSGQKIAINTFDEYGIPGVGNKARFQYTGQVWLPELGMYHYKARVYSPTMGRFLQTDPVGYDDQINLYAYVANDPVNGRDPDGTESVWESISAWAKDQWSNLRSQAERIPGDIRSLPSHVLNGTTGLPPTLSGGGNLATAPVRAVNAVRVSTATRVAARIESRAASLAARAGKNSVTVRFPGGFNRVDLAGDAHYSKELGRRVATPHVQPYKENVVNGVVKNVSRVGDPVPATMNDLKAVDDVLRRANR